MNIRIYIYTFFSFIILVLIASCSPTRHLKENEYWVVKNNIKFEKQDYKIQEEKDLLLADLTPILRPKTNLKVLFFYPLLFFRNAFYKADSTQKMRYWFKTKVGEEPAIFNRDTTEKVTEHLRNKLNQKGYFNATTEYEVKYKKKRATVNYKIKTNAPVLIDSVFFESPDSNIQLVMLQAQNKTFLKKGERLDMGLFDQEKTRLTIAIRNAGYESFNWNYIYFEADTINSQKYTAQAKKIFQPIEQGETRANIYINVLPYSDTLIEHPRSIVRDIYIIPDDIPRSIGQTRTSKYDTSYVIQHRTKSHKIQVIDHPSDLLETDSVLYIFLNRFDSKRVVKERILAQNIHLKKGKYYHYESGIKTIQSINELDVFQLPKVEYRRIEPNKTDSIDAFVIMQPTDGQNLSTNEEINTYSSNLGAALNFSYRNRNIFRGAEAFSFYSEFGGVFRTKRDSIFGSDGTWLDRFVSLLDINTEFRLNLPRFIGPSKLSRRMEGARTRFTLGYRYLRQGTDLKNVSSIYAKILSYEWRLKNKTNHYFTFNPILLSVTFEPTLSNSFENRLSFSNPALLASLKDKFVIPSMEFTYTYTSPERANSNYWFVKLYGETAGNFMYLTNKMVSSDPIKFFGNIDYSQYIKADIDARYSIYFNSKRSLVFRIMAGAALPYGNANETDKGIPFSRRFFLGGPSSMRAWALRHVGPGRIKVDPSAPFQLGDIRLEMNAEFRFKFNSWIAGAIFADAGNVWLWKPSSVMNTAVSPPLAEPETGVFGADFIKELALGGGFGLRLDFTFFIIRFDYGIQLYNPSGYELRPDGTVKYWNFPLDIKLRWNPVKNSNFVLGIGYPF